LPKKILLLFGTRPEAIKMAPLLFAFNKLPESFEVKVCITAQHRHLLDQVIDFFGIKVDYDLDLMRPGQDLHSLTSDIITSTKTIFESYAPDLVLVHGDTATSMAAALSAFYLRIPVGHVEAGLRTFNKYSPFPEEINRCITSKIADFHFAPTSGSQNNLIAEGIPQDTIILTGNTVIDALKLGLEKINSRTPLSIDKLTRTIPFRRPFILVTGHRRENFGEGFISICQALRQIALTLDVDIIYPVHLNPNVQGPVFEYLSNISSVFLIEPQPYESFIWLMSKCKLIITDSGGVQEEAPTLGKPVLVMRDTTERPEAVTAGTVILVGTDYEKIVNVTTQLLLDDNQYNIMSLANNPYGDGEASNRIVDFIRTKLI
jgi:UDP-N-acetylglucosamine 2-epimerase (non-hydrolysing)